MSRKFVTNWGNYPAVEADITEASNIAEISEFISRHSHLIARGNGRCYGDSSLGDIILSTLKLNRFIAFDKANGTIECESGVLLSEILQVIVPNGFFLPVTPGTKYVTLGGAIAADVHGKNHHCSGSFSNHVIEIVLISCDGKPVRCSRDYNSELFWKTCGGMGLTGVIVSARFRLLPIETAYISETAVKAHDLETIMTLFEKNSAANYSVAWIDCLAPSRFLGRSILLLGEHCPIDHLPSKLRRSPLRPPIQANINLPTFLPRFTINRMTVKAFNFGYFHRILSKTRDRVLHFDPYFYPLDSIQNWNRIYGRKGFLQYQFVLPKERSYDGLKIILERVRASGQGSPLAVLKLFGMPDDNAVMSFPIEGYTLALDFKLNGTVLQLLDELDDIVLAHGGRIYLAKDARMKPRTFHESYDRIVLGDRFQSNQSQRLEI